MKNASDYAKRLTALLKELRKRADVEPTKPDRDPIHQVIHGFLTWESTHNQAEQAYPRLLKSAVDLNDLRVTDPAELIQIIGPRYARVKERAHLLSRVLNAIYVREHVTEMPGMTKRPKREARAYLEELDGMVPYVAATVALLTLDAHAVPVDEQLLNRLKNDGVVDEEATLEEAQSFLEHQIAAADGLEAYYLLRAYVERPIKVDLPGGPRKSTTKKVPTKKTIAKKAPAKKTTTKKAATTKAVGKKTSTKKATTKAAAKSTIKKKTAKKSASKKSTGRG